MKSKSGFFTVKVLAACAIIFSTLSAINAQAPKQAPVNPEFLQYLQDHARKTAAVKDSHGRGIIPSPIDFSYLKGRTSAGLRALQALPTSYDLRTLGKLTPVKDQDPYGTCWTFATYGSLESTLLTAETRDFSENNLANLHGFDYGYDDGGTHLMSTAYLTRWSGPINEVDDPYSNGPGHSPSNLPPQKHVQEVLFLAGKTNALDNTAIKQAVVDHGAIYVTMYANFNTNYYYNPDNYSFYYDGDSNTDHAVAVVGWDDDYAASNFIQTPPGNGAYIVRNSWGTNWGDHGYFYCSYYDTRMCSEVSASFDNGEPATNYASAYQYDPLGRVTEYGYSATTAWGANIFTATNSETLRAVGFYTTDIDANYEIYVYENVATGSPRSGTLKLTQTGSIPQSGYHTVVLDTPANIASGLLFSVVIKFTNPSYVYPMAIEYAIDGYSSRATASPGESFVSADGTTWTDTTSWNSTANVCIKAYCGAGGAPAAGVPAIADYDGDQKSDPALYTESTGTWQIKRSAAGYALLTTTFGGLGGEGLASVSADYDGDGLADPAVYQEATGRWVIVPSTSGYSVAIILSQTLGGAGYAGVPADYDGDRFADPAVYQSAHGTWNLLLSSAGYYPIEKNSFLGGEGYSAAPADYDGDRLADPAIYGETTGLWTILLSSAGYYSITLSATLGGTGYLPCPGDYDGDGLADPTVKSESGNEWIVMFSTGGYTPTPLTILFE